MGIIPSITGKIELVYEGEQEGPYEVALNLLNKSIRTQFIEYFPNPELLKKKKMVNKKGEEKALDNPYKSITTWFDGGNHLNLLLDMKDADKVVALYKVDGLFGLVKKYYPHANEKESALLMEFVLHGLAAFSLINKKMIDGKIEFNDLMSSMMNLGSFGEEDDYNESDYQ